MLKMKEVPGWDTNEKPTEIIFTTPKTITEKASKQGVAFLGLNWRVTKSMMLTSKSAARMKNRFKLVVNVSIGSDRLRVQEEYLYLRLDDEDANPFPKDLFPHISDLLLKLGGFPHDHMYGGVHWDAVIFSMANELTSWYKKTLKAEKDELDRRTKIHERAMKVLETAKAKEAVDAENPHTVTLQPTPPPA